MIDHAKSLPQVPLAIALKGSLIQKENCTLVCDAYPKECAQFAFLDKSMGARTFMM